jgi:hypothetical protein
MGIEHTRLTSFLLEEPGMVQVLFNKLKVCRSLGDNDEFFRRGMLDTFRLIEIHMIGGRVDKNEQIISMWQAR